MLGPSAGEAHELCRLPLPNAAYQPLMIFLNERYPAERRARGTAMSWNPGFMLGGLMPTLVFVIAILTGPQTPGALDREHGVRTAADDATPV